MNESSNATILRKAVIARYLNSNAKTVDVENALLKTITTLKFDVVNVWLLIRNMTFLIKI